jgi:hypothetical protein
MNKQNRKLFSAFSDFLASSNNIQTETARYIRDGDDCGRNVLREIPELKRRLKRLEKLIAAAECGHPSCPEPYRAAKP